MVTQYLGPEKAVARTDALVPLASKSSLLGARWDGMWQTLSLLLFQAFQIVRALRNVAR